MDIKIHKNDIETFILNYVGERNFDNICNELYNIYVSTTKVDDYVIKEIVTYTIHKVNEKERLIKKRKEQLKQLKKLELPEQRSKEWYEMRKD